MTPHAYLKRPAVVYGFGLAALAAVALASLATGAVPVPWHQVLAVIFGRDRGSSAAVIVLQLRLPRVLSASLVGAGLALSGVVLQALLRNPLADPFTLGVSGGAGFFVTALAAFAPAWFIRPWAAPVAGFAGALVAGALVFVLALRHAFSSRALILCGVILSFFFGSLIMLNFAFGRPEALQSAMTWLTGDLSLTNGTTALTTLLALVIPAAYVIAAAERLDLLAIGEERALCLGLPVRPMRRRLFIAAAWMTGVCVACAGVIGFVGFMIPHLVRMLVGARHRRLLPLAALLGAVFLMLADTLARSLFNPMELPVGVLTGVIGAGVFLGFYLRTEPREVA